MTIATFNINEHTITPLIPIITEWGTLFWDMSEMEKSLGLAGYHLLCYYDEQEKVGGLVFYLDTLDAFELLFIYVTKKARKKGVGHKLMTAFIESCQQAGKERAFLEVRVSHIAAQNLYKAHGFCCIAKRPRYYKDNEDAYIMEKFLR